MSTPIARPVVAGIRLRRGKPADVRGAARFLAETLAVVRQIAPTVWRHHAVFVTSPFEMLQAESQHRAHAIVHQVIADAAAGTLACAFHARATTPTIGAHLINVPARLARGARRPTLHLPQGWPWQAAWNGLHAAVHRPTATMP